MEYMEIYIISNGMVVLFCFVLFGDWYVEAIIGHLCCLQGHV